MAADHRRPSLSRRQFLRGAGAAGLGLVAECGRLPFSAPPASKTHRIGNLSGSPPNSANTTLFTAFREGLHDLSYEEGQNLLVEQRYANGDD